MEAEQALRAARSRILKRISFLSPVLEVVEWREQDGFEGIGTDGRFLLYGNAYVREIAETGGNGRLEREYLHAVCHIICQMCIRDRDTGPARKGGGGGGGHQALPAGPDGAHPVSYTHLKPGL